MKPKEIQYSHKKQVGFTLQQKKAFEILESYGININNFIRIAVADKIKAEWKLIKEENNKTKYPF
jgi:hypothetical protein